MKKKTISGLALIVAIIGINIVTLLPKQASAGWYCYGYHWYKCIAGPWVIRCDCDAGPICYASWQDLCPEPE